MNHNITQWAIRHGVSHVALDELRSMFVSPETDVKRCIHGASEAAVVNNVRLEASRVLYSLVIMWVRVWISAVV